MSSTGVTAFVDELRAEEDNRSAVLLGMGGSTLAPEVMREVLGVREGYLDLHVLDSTDPAAVLAVAAAVDLESTLFVVSSKSGGTTETASFHAYFHERLQELDGDHAGHHFVAITDEGTSLQQEALDQGLPRRVRQPVRHRGPVLGALASSAWCPRRSSAPTSSGCSTASGPRPSRAARTSRPARNPRPAARRRAR